MTALTLPRMTRVTWYKHRATVLGIPGLFLLAVVLLLVDGLAQRAFISAHHLGGCLRPYQRWPARSLCESPAWYDNVNPFRTELITLAVGLLIMAVGMFAGVPWVAREFESGAFRYTWTQSVSPRRWLFGTFGPLVLLAAAAAALCSLAAHWWYQVAQWTGGNGDPWNIESFELTPLSLLSWTLLAMALALLSGVMIRRVLPAMLAFFAVFGGCLIFAQLWLREHLFAIGVLTRRISMSRPSSLPSDSYFAGTWFAGPGGQRLDPDTIYARMYPQSGLADPDRWLAQHHYTYWEAWQPHQRLIWFLLARDGMLLVVAVLAVLAAAWWLRKRPAE